MTEQAPFPFDRPTRQQLEFLDDYVSPAVLNVWAAGGDPEKVQPLRVVNPEAIDFMIEAAMDSTINESRRAHGAIFGNGIPQRTAAYWHIERSE